MHVITLKQMIKLNQDNASNIINTESRLMIIVLNKIIIVTQLQINSNIATESKLIIVINIITIHFNQDNTAELRCIKKVLNIITICTIQSR